MKSTSQLIACLIAVPSVAGLAVGPRASNVKASMGSNNPAMCTRLESQQQAHAAAPFQEGRKHLIDTEQWYECSEPADDPVMTCILAPEWMDLADETWLCSDALKSDDKGGSSYGEDSY